VNCADQPLDFFPDIYNEDWLFLARHTRAGVVTVGDVRQVKYDPYAHPDRARGEEFGDLLAEGLYALFSGGGSVAHATSRYWEKFMSARHELIEAIFARLLLHMPPGAGNALVSLSHARAQLGSITPEACTSYVAAWGNDRQIFARTAAGLSNVRSHRDAFDMLNLGDAWLGVGVEGVGRSRGRIRRGSVFAA
jgi:hypothetical protein